MTPDAALLGEIQHLFASYAAVVDDGPLEEWPDFFTEQCLYRIVARENFDRGLPLSTLCFESRDMLADRVYAVTGTLFHQPYHQRHIVGLPRIRAVSGERLDVDTNYLVVRARLNEMPDILNVGRYRDVLVRGAQGLRFRERVCVFDNELIPNSLIYPI